MPIKYIQRKDIDDSKYNACVQGSKQSLLYGYSWYLDIVCDHWDVLVLDNYKAVMPIPWRKKYFIKYAYQPLWVLQLGIFSINENYSLQNFLNELQKHFRFIEFRLNAGNIFQNNNPHIISKEFQELSLNQGYDKIKHAYQSDRKKDLKKSKKHQLKIAWGRGQNEFIQLFRQNVGKRTPEIKDPDYNNLKHLMSLCSKKNLGEVCTVYQEDQLVAGAFFLKDQKNITILCSSTDFSNRNNGANTFLIDQAIQRYTNNYQALNFGGSSIPSIASYFSSFAAKTYQYPMIRLNRLPLLIRVFKS